MITPKNTLLFYIACFVSFGIPGLLLPTEFAELLGYALDANGSVMEFTGAYGGLILGIAAYLIYCLKHQINAGLIAVLAVIGGLFIGRLYGLAIDEKLNSIQITFLTIEAITIVLISFVLRQSHTSVKVM